MLIIVNDMTKLGQKTYSSSEIQSLLEALEKQTRRAARKADAAIDRISRLAFEPYYEYRESLAELEGVIVLIEDRMANADKAALAKLTDYHTRLITDLLRMKIDVILRVFPALEVAASLPMGAQKVFLATLWEMKETVEHIDRAQMGHLLDDDARKRLLVAETILSDVAARAPRLLEIAEMQNREDQPQ